MGQGRELKESEGNGKSEGVRRRGVGDEGSEY